MESPIPVAKPARAHEKSGLRSGHTLNLPLSFVWLVKCLLNSEWDDHIRHCPILDILRVTEVASNCYPGTAGTNRDVSSKPRHGVALTISSLFCSSDSCSQGYGCGGLRWRTWGQVISGSFCGAIFSCPLKQFWNHFPLSEILVFLRGHG